MAYVYGTVDDDTVTGYEAYNDHLFGGPEHNTYGYGGASRDTLLEGLRSA